MRRMPERRLFSRFLVMVGLGISIALPADGANGQVVYRFAHFPDWITPNPYDGPNPKEGTRASHPPRGAAAFDYDGDGVKDLVMGGMPFAVLYSWPYTSSKWVHVVIYRGAGGGKFYPDTARSVPTSYPPNDLSNVMEMASGDFNGDGAVDIYLGRAAIQHPKQAIADRLLLNDGLGSFVFAPSSSLPVQQLITVDCKAIDIDGDGDLDVLTATVGSTLNRIYVNNGKGVFTDESAKRYPKGLAGYDTAAVVPGDVDGDGDVDLFWATGGRWSKAPTVQKDLLLLNDGKGVFKLSAQPAFNARNTTNGVFEDLDGDGDLDLVTTGQGDSARLFVNDGRGSFTDATSLRFPNPVRTNYCVRTADVDEDGDPDILLFGPFDLYLNDGKGFFRRAPSAADAIKWGYGEGALVEDLDGDGDVDVLHYYGTDKPLIYYNLQRQLYVPPDRFAIGEAARFEVYSTQRRVVGAVFIALQAGVLKLPGMGTWYLDPASSVPLLPFAFKNHGGRRVFQVKIPFDTNLIHHTAYCQAAMFDVNSKELRFSNFTANPIKYPWQK